VRIIYGTPAAEGLSSHCRKRLFPKKRKTYELQRYKGFLAELDSPNHGIVLRQKETNCTIVYLLPLRAESYAIGTGILRVTGFL
jgi:hypothetical protein